MTGTQLSKDSSGELLEPGPEQDKYNNRCRKISESKVTEFPTIPELNISAKLHTFTDLLASILLRSTTP